MSHASLGNTQNPAQADSAAMNKTVITVAFLVLAALGIAGVIVVVLLRPEAVNTVVSLLVTVLGLASTAVVTFYMLGKQGAVIDTIKTQTNGNLSAKEEENRRLTDIIISMGGNPALRTTPAVIVGAPSE